MYASRKEILNSYFIERVLSNRCARRTYWKIWPKSKRHRVDWRWWTLITVIFVTFLFFRILIQSRPSWFLGWLKWASLCCPFFHHSWILMIQKLKYVPLAVLEWIVQMLLSSVLFFFFFKYLFIWLPGVCSMWDVPWPGIEPWPFARGVQSLSHWTTKEVPLCSFNWNYCFSCL